MSKPTYPSPAAPEDRSARHAAVVAAAARLSEHRILAAEVAALEADEEDRREMLAVAETMEDLRVSG